uniref:Predicted AAA-ATPase n=1 Tax=Candidatus Kentrum sp. FW TaxID=2126338 RepID=A0A450U017_9GAMM|nr:MAG: Predicted AAA-ATPase [Candidatus Kentron sp. FW]
MNTIPNQRSKLHAGKPPIGLFHFPTLIREEYAYVDKSLLVQSVLDSPAQVLLLPRPRRFGKTLNLSMLQVFFDRDKPEHADLFQGLAIVFDGKRLQVREQLSNTAIGIDGRAGV